MDTRPESEPAARKDRATVDRRSEHEIVVTRTFDAPARLVFAAWSEPALFQRWWVPRSFPISLES